MTARRWRGRVLHTFTSDARQLPSSDHTRTQSLHHRDGLGNCDDVRWTSASKCSTNPSHAKRRIHHHDRGAHAPAGVDRCNEVRTRRDEQRHTIPTTNATSSESTREEVDLTLEQLPRHSAPDTRNGLHHGIRIGGVCRACFEGRPQCSMSRRLRLVLVHALVNI